MSGYKLGCLVGCLVFGLCEIELISIDHKNLKTFKIVHLCLSVVFSFKLGVPTIRGFGLF